MIYLDNNATTKPAEVVVEAMSASLREGWHNPSSTHRGGQAARYAVEQARQQVAALIGCRDRELIFMSGGTEADNLAVLGSLAAQPGRQIIVASHIEHEAVQEAAEAAAEQGAMIEWLPIQSNGVVDVNALEVLLKSRGDEIAIVSIMWCNNETGVIQPIEEIGTLCREAGVRFHTDAVQWVGKMETHVAALPVDLLTLSGHKFHGPKGTGALYVRRGVRLEPRSLGGAQERERRGGTENTAGIAGLGAAASLACQWLGTNERERLESMRDQLERSIIERVGDAVVMGGDGPRIWNTSNIAFNRIEAEALLILLSERGVCASAGAACSSGSLDPSPVILAMGVERSLAHGALRFSLSRETSQEDLDQATEVICESVERLRRSMSAV